MIEFTLNGTPVRLDVEPDMPLLWAIREHAGLTGTKFGCGAGICGACTVHFNGMAMRSCVLPVGGVAGAQITTIEGLDHPVKQAWLDEQVPQCGYCQPGQMMAAAALLASNPDPSDEDVDRTMTNLCRCATYDRVRRGIRRAVELLPPPPEPEPQPTDETAEGLSADGATEASSEEGAAQPEPEPAGKGPDPAPEAAEAAPASEAPDPVPEAAEAAPAGKAADPVPEAAEPGPAEAGPTEPAPEGGAQ